MIIFPMMQQQSSCSDESSEYK